MLSKKDLEAITTIVATVLAAQASAAPAPVETKTESAPKAEKPKFESNWNESERTETGWISTRKDGLAAVETVHTSDGKVFYACLPDGEEFYRQGRPYNTRRAARKAASQMVRHGRKAA